MAPYRTAPSMQAASSKQQAPHTHTHTHERYSMMMLLCQVINAERGAKRSRDGRARAGGSGGWILWWRRRNCNTAWAPPQHLFLSMTGHVAILLPDRHWMTLQTHPVVTARCRATGQTRTTQSPACSCNSIQTHPSSAVSRQRSNKIQITTTRPK